MRQPVGCINTITLQIELSQHTTEFVHPGFEYADEATLGRVLARREM